MEYRGIDLATGAEVFHFGPLHGTNNIGEFLAIVHALALLEKQGDTQKTIYSDSYNAILWVKKKQCKTKLKRTPQTETLYQIIDVYKRQAFENLFVAYHPHLTLGEMRGKILLLSRDVYADKPIGAYVRGWTHEPDFTLQSKGELYHEDSQGALYVQDFYDTSEGKQAVALKCQSIKRLLDFSARSRQQENARCPLVINHTSGCLLYTSPPHTTRSWLHHNQ